MRLSQTRRIRMFVCTYILYIIRVYSTIIKIITTIRGCVEKKSSLQNLAAGVWLVFSIGFYIPIQTPTWHWTTMLDMCNNMCVSMYICVHML
jgi:hypothetical protein